MPTVFFHTGLIFHELLLERQSFYFQKTPDDTQNNKFLFKNGCLRIAREFIRIGR